MTIAQIVVAVADVMISRRAFQERFQAHFAIQVIRKDILLSLLEFSLSSEL